MNIMIITCNVNEYIHNLSRSRDSIKVSIENVIKV